MSDLSEVRHSVCLELRCTCSLVSRPSLCPSSNCNMTFEHGGSTRFKSQHNNCLCVEVRPGDEASVHVEYSNNVCTVSFCRYTVEPL